MEEAVASFEQRRAFQRAIALNLRVTHGRNDQWASNPESVQEELEAFLRAHKLGLLLPNIQRVAGAISLEELVRLSPKQLNDCADDVEVRVALKAAVSAKKQELYPHFQAPRVSRWWSAARATPERQSSTAAHQEGQFRVHSNKRATQNAMQAHVALMLVRNLGTTVTVRSLRRAIQLKSNKRVLDVCFFASGRPADLQHTEGSAADDLTVKRTALLECYQKDAQHISDSCHHLEVDGCRISLEQLKLRRRGGGGGHSDSPCPWHGSGCKCASALEAKLHASKIQALARLVRAEEAACKASPLDVALEARWREAKRRLHVQRYGISRRIAVNRTSSPRVVWVTEARAGIDKAIPIPSAGTGLGMHGEYKTRQIPPRPWREPTRQAHVSPRVSTGVYMGCYFLGAEAARVKTRVPRRAWGVGEPERPARFRLNASPGGERRGLRQMAQADSAVEGRAGETDEMREAVAGGDTRRRRQSRLGKMMRRVPVVSRAGAAEYARRLDEYLAYVHDLGLLTEANYDVARAIFHAGNARLLQGEHGLAKEGVRQPIEAPLPKMAQEGKQRDAEKSAVRASRAPCLPARPLPLGLEMRRRAARLISTPKFDPSVVGRLVRVVEEAVHLSRVLMIAGEPVPKMLCDHDLLRSVAVCKTTKGARKALRACDTLSSVRKAATKRVGDILRGKPLAVSGDAQRGGDEALAVKVSPADASGTVHQGLGVVVEEVIEEVADVRQTPGQGETRNKSSQAPAVGGPSTASAFGGVHSSDDRRRFQQLEVDYVLCGDEEVQAMLDGDEVIVLASQASLPSPQALSTGDETQPDETGARHLMQAGQAERQGETLDSSADSVGGAGEGGEDAAGRVVCEEEDGHGDAPSQCGTHRVIPSRGLGRWIAVWTHQRLPRPCIQRNQYPASVPGAGPRAPGNGGQLQRVSAQNSRATSPGAGKDETSTSTLRSKRLTKDEKARARIGELERVLAEEGPDRMTSAQLQELKEGLKQQYRQKLSRVHTDATIDRGRTLAFQFLQLNWNFPEAVLDRLAKQVPAATLKEVTCPSKLVLEIDAELSFEGLLPAIQSSLKDILLILGAKGPRYVGDDAAKKKAQVDKDERRWEQVQQAVIGFTYQHPISGRDVQVSEESSYEDMLFLFSRAAAKQHCDLSQPVLLASPIFAMSVLV